MAKPAWLEPLEQAAHFAMGFGARLVFLDYLLWRREAVSQWPPGDPYLDARFDGINRVDEEVTQLDRVADMMTDMRWYFIGGTTADLVRTALVIWWIVT